MRRGLHAHLTALALLASAAGLAGCGGSATNPVAQRKARSTRRDPGQWLEANAATKTATITLELDYDKEASGLNIDGAVKGALLFAVPSGWTVQIRCVNKGQSERYSCVLSRAPAQPVVDPSLVDVLHPTEGVAPGGSFTFSFEIREPTRYRLIAVSKQNQPTGMWVVLKISDGGLPYARWLR